MARYRNNVAMMYGFGGKPLSGVDPQLILATGADVGLTVAGLWIASRQELPTLVRAFAGIVALKTGIDLALTYLPR